MVVINEHEAMGVKTVYLIDVTMFQIVIIRAVITHETRTHKKNHLLKGDNSTIEQKYHFVQLLSVRLKTASTYFDKVSFPF